MFSKLKLLMSLSDDDSKYYCRAFPEVVRDVLKIEENQLEDSDVNGMIIGTLIFYTDDLDQMKRLTDDTFDQILQKLPDTIKSETTLDFQVPADFVQQVTNKYEKLLNERGSKKKFASNSAPILVRYVVRTIIERMSRLF